MCAYTFKCSLFDVKTTAKIDRRIFEHLQDLWVAAQWKELFRFVQVQEKVKPLQLLINIPAEIVAETNEFSWDQVLDDVEDEGDDEIDSFE